MLVWTPFRSGPPMIRVTGTGEVEGGNHGEAILPEQHRQEAHRCLRRASEYLDVEPMLVRIAWVVVAIFTGGAAILAYVALVFIMPLDEVA